MKNKRFLLGLLVTALALSLTAVGCEEPEITDPALNGTWVFEQTYTGGGSIQTYKFDNGSYEYESSISNTMYSGPYYRNKGTYSTDSNKINWGNGTTEYNGAYFVAMRNYYDSLGIAIPSSVGYLSDFQSRWYSSKEYEDIMRPYQQPNQQPTETYTSLGTTYEVSGNTLTITSSSKKDSDGTVTTSSTTYTKIGGSGGNSGGNSAPKPPTNNS
jgi:hypothetical protein